LEGILSLKPVYCGGRETHADESRRSSLASRLCVLAPRGQPWLCMWASAETSWPATVDVKRPLGHQASTSTRYSLHQHVSCVDSVHQLGASTRCVNTFGASTRYINSVHQHVFVRQLVASTRSCVNSSHQLGASTRSCVNSVRQLGASTRFVNSVRQLGASTRCINSVRQLGASTRCVNSVRQLGASTRCVNSVRQLGASTRLRGMGRPFSQEGRCEPLVGPSTSKPHRCRCGITLTLQCQVQ
jgi:hypothetical protein